MTTDEAEVKLLEYLLGVASGTQGAEVWRSLFAEMRQAILDKNPGMVPPAHGFKEFAKGKDGGCVDVTGRQ